jgi:hypothetical protein
MTRVDLARTAAIAWLSVAIGLTVTIGPSLGWRGWIWMGAHNLLCAVGAGHELLRRRERAASSDQSAHTTARS